MIDIAEETSGFRRSWLSQDLRLLIPTFSLLNAPVDFTIGLRCIKNALLPLGDFKKDPVRRWRIGKGLEQATGLEPVTHQLAAGRSTTELRLPNSFLKSPNPQFRYKA